MKPKLSIKQLSVTLDSYPILYDVDLTLERGQIGCLLGPSGCGKTTLLRTVVGFERPAAGRIKIDDRIIAAPDTYLPPEKRGVGLVFQDLALFPHLSVADNIRFGLKYFKRSDAEARVAKMLELSELESYRDSFPHQLSGGQQQRLALVRAMAPQPHLILLDEPFSSQDTERRLRLAAQVREILAEENTTALLVTHDQHEAFAMADQIGVMNQGRLLQWDTAYNLYHVPDSRFVADFIGEGELLCGVVSGPDRIDTAMGTVTGQLSQPFAPGTQIELLVRPNHLVHDVAGQPGEVVDKQFRGTNYHYTLRLPNRIRLPYIAPSYQNYQIGDRIPVKMVCSHLVVFPEAQL